MSQENRHRGFVRKNVCTNPDILGCLLPQINKQVGVWRGMGHVVIYLSQKPALIRVHLPSQYSYLSLVHWVLERHNVLCVQSPRARLFRLVKQVLTDTYYK